jgi:hypothetical protein
VFDDVFQELARTVLPICGLDVEETQIFLQKVVALQEMGFESEAALEALFLRRGDYSAAVGTLLLRKSNREDLVFAPAIVGEDAFFGAPENSKARLEKDAFFGLPENTKARLEKDAFFGAPEKSDERKKARLEKEETLDPEEKEELARRRNLARVITPEMVRKCKKLIEVG